MEKTKQQKIQLKCNKCEYVWMSASTQDKTSCPKCKSLVSTKAIEFKGKLVKPLKIGSSNISVFDCSDELIDLLIELGAEYEENQIKSDTATIKGGNCSITFFRNDA